MAKNLLNKYVWLVETIYKAKQISFEEINQKWLENDMSEDKPLSIRTFHKWRIAIEEMFGLIIENEQGGRYRYSIQRRVEKRFHAQLAIQHVNGQQSDDGECQCQR